MHCGWHCMMQGTVLWQLCSASVKPVGTKQVCLAGCETIPKSSLKFRTEVILLKYAAKLPYKVITLYKWYNTH